MGMDKRTGNLIMLLVFVLVITGILYAYQQEVFVERAEERNWTDKSPVNEGYQLITGNTTKKDSRQIVTDRFTGELDESGQIIAIGESGEAYSVRKGVVLTDGMVIEANETTYRIHRVNDPEKSVSS